MAVVGVGGQELEGPWRKLGAPMRCILQPLVPTQLLFNTTTRHGC
jgi:hypothetical protein